MKIIKDEHLETVKQEFEMICRIELQVRRSLFEMIKDKFSKTGASIEVKN
jgi:hypothetical protein